MFFSSRRQFATTVLLMMMAHNVVEAYPSGAGNCVIGKAAVDVVHPASTLTGETFASRGYEIVLAVTGSAEELVVTTPSTTVNAGGSYTVSVRGTKDRTFRGALIVYDGDAGALTPKSGDATAKANDFCTTAGLTGVTHTDRTDKTVLAGELTGVTGDSVLHVTVVETNDADGSVYFYQQVALTVAATAPTMAAAPVAVALPTMTPLAPAPTIAAAPVPVKAPTTYGGGSTPTAPTTAATPTAPSAAAAAPTAPSAAAGASAFGGWTTVAALAMGGSTLLAMML